MKNRYLKEIISNLLISPIYLFVFAIYRILDITNQKLFLIPALLMVIVPLAGVLLSYLYVERNKVIPSIILSIFVVIFGIIFAYNFYYTYFVDVEGWGTLGYALFALINYVIFRILCYVYCGITYGFKKLGINIIIAIILSIISLAIIFISNRIYYGEMF